MALGVDAAPLAEAAAVPLAEQEEPCHCHDVLLAAECDGRHREVGASTHERLTRGDARM